MDVRKTIKKKTKKNIKSSQAICFALKHTVFLHCTVLQTRRINVLCMFSDKGLSFASLKNSEFI